MLFAFVKKIVQLLLAFSVGALLHYCSLLDVMNFPVPF